MADKLKSCCRNALIGMIKTGEMGSALQVLLAASPFVLILPDILPPGSSKAAIETPGEKLVEMSCDEVLGNIIDTSSAPDFADSVRNASEMTLGFMHRTALIHSLTHAKGLTEGQIWEKLKEVYDEEGAIRSGGGWDLNPFW